MTILEYPTIGTQWFQQTPSNCPLGSATSRLSQHSPFKMLGLFYCNYELVHIHGSKQLQQFLIHFHFLVFNLQLLPFDLQTIQITLNNGQLVLEGRKLSSIFLFFSKSLVQPSLHACKVGLGRLKCLDCQASYQACVCAWCNSFFKCKTQDMVLRMSSSATSFLVLTTSKACFNVHIVYLQVLEIHMWSFKPCRKDYKGRDSFFGGGLVPTKPGV